MDSRMAITDIYLLVCWIPRPFHLNRTHQTIPGTFSWEVAGLANLEGAAQSALYSACYGVARRQG